MASQPNVNRKKVAMIVFVVAQLLVASLLLVVFSGSSEREGRVKVTLAVAKAGKIQEAITGYYEDHNTLPADNSALRILDKQSKPYLTDTDEHGDPTYMVNIANGVITLTFSANQEPVSGKTLIFAPLISSGKLDWSCDTGSVEAIYRPTQCGGKQT